MGDPPLNVAALTLGEAIPSARFRVRQFTSELHKYGIYVKEYPARTHVPAGFGGRPGIVLRWTELLASRSRGMLASWRADVSWLSKQMLPGLPTLEPLLRRPWVLDVDDAMWLARPLGQRAAREAARRAAAVVAGNRYIAEYYSQYNDRVHIIPTSIDTDRFLPSGVAPERFTIAWTGSAATLRYLENLARPLARFLELHPDAKLRVICDREPRLKGVPPAQLEWVPWTSATELSGLSAISVGIMPLPRDDITLGKCSFKMLQYMAVGRPVIVSPVGANAEILAAADVGWGPEEEDAWLPALEAAYTNETLCKQRGQQGRLLVERAFSVKVSAKLIAAVFRELPG